MEMHVLSFSLLYSFRVNDKKSDTPPPQSSKFMLTTIMLTVFTLSE